MSYRWLAVSFVRWLAANGGSTGEGKGGEESTVEDRGEESTGEQRREREGRGEKIEEGSMVARVEGGREWKGSRGVRG